MHCHQRVIQKTEGEKANTYYVEHKISPRFQRYILLGIRLKLLRIGKMKPCDDKQDKGDDSRDSKGKKAERIALKSAAAGLEKHYHIEQKGPKHRSELVEQLLQAEGLASSFLRSGKRYDSILCRLLDGLSELLDYQQYAAAIQPFSPTSAKAGIVISSRQ